ncbi:MAG TPA: hypothetical protein VHB77_00025, partial [Planctomycetaceae bacterium]|nr:hypothetical protein [Planctomycetaceae bacterium]
MRGVMMALAWLALSLSPCAAHDFLEGFDSEKVSWQPFFTNPDQARLLSHRRHAQILKNGQASENIEIDVANRPTRVILQHKLPPSRVLDELNLSMWVRSNRAGGTLAVRVVFPHQIDPETSKPLNIVLTGDKYVEAGSWQLLSCRTADNVIEKRLQLLRYRHRKNIDESDSYVDQAYVILDAAQGTTEIFLDELKFGPVVSPTTA